MIFQYPNERFQRRHGPSGYSSYELFRPWLRDEFVFRCVYCLKREVWGQITGEFELDHFEPKSRVPERNIDYVNLVYSCRRCNLCKTDQAIDDPLLHLREEYIVVDPDGSIKGRTFESRRLITQLDLDSPGMQQWRVMWMRIVQLAAERDPNLFSQLVGFPKELPDLGRLKPPMNSRPEGVAESWYAKRRQGLLPDRY
jgi:hypothetical protein